MRMEIADWKARALQAEADIPTLESHVRRLDELLADSHAARLKAEEALREIDSAAEDGLYEAANPFLVAIQRIARAALSEKGE